MHKKFLFTFFLLLPLLGARSQLPQNVATNGYAIQSSHWLNAGFFPAYFAINDRLNDFTHTSGAEGNSWWILNLGGIYRISSIEIFNRPDCCDDRLTDFQLVIFGPDGMTEVYREYFGEQVPAQPGSMEKRFEVPVSGQYLHVLKGPGGPGLDTLSLAEVRVFAHGQMPAPAPLTQGSTGSSGNWSILQVTDNGPLTRLETAVQSINSPLGIRQTTSSSTINFFGQGTNHGNFATGESSFLLSSTSPGGLLVQDLALAAKAHISIPPGQGGDYTFSVWADDSFELLIDGKVVCWTDGTNAASLSIPVENVGWPSPSFNVNIWTNYSPPNVLGVASLNPGIHSIELVYFQSSQFSHLELAASKGRKTSFDNTFRLVGDVASGGLELVTGIAPVITQQPTNQKVSFAGAASFLVEASGSSALTYQWFFEGQPIPHANDSILVIPSASDSSAGTYSVIVRNWAGEAQSFPAILEVEGSMGDTDNDGLPDEWEYFNFGSLLTEPTEDPDEDGASNRVEWEADTWPLDPQSVPKIRDYKKVSNGMEITWTGGSSVRQILQRTRSLDGESAWEPVAFFDPPTETEQRFVDSPPAGALIFYRILFERP